VIELLHVPAPGISDDRAEPIDRRRHIGHGVEYERFRFVFGLLPQLLVAGKDMADSADEVFRARRVEIRIVANPVEERRQRLGC